MTATRTTAGGCPRGRSDLVESLHSARGNGTAASSEKHVMATARKELVWSITKNLYKLSATQAYHLAKDIATGCQDVNTLEPPDEEGCVECILSYIKSDSLLTSEDQGMSQLLIFNDLVCNVIANCDSVVATNGVAQAQNTFTATSPAVGYTHAAPALPPPSSTQYTALPISHHHHHTAWPTAAHST